jgi:hypothetical protein
MRSRPAESASPSIRPTPDRICGRSSVPRRSSSPERRRHLRAGGRRRRPGGRPQPRAPAHRLARPPGAQPRPRADCARGSALGLRHRLRGPRSTAASISSGSLAHSPSSSPGPSTPGAILTPPPPPSPPRAGVGSRSGSSVPSAPSSTPPTSARRSPTRCCRRASRAFSPQPAALVAEPLTAPGRRRARPIPGSNTRCPSQLDDPHRSRPCGRNLPDRGGAITVVPRHLIIRRVRRSKTQGSPPDADLPEWRLWQRWR